MLADRVRATSFSLQPHVVATVVEDGAVLLDLETKYFYHLNAGAWAIVQLFESSGASTADIERACRAWGAGDDDMPSVSALLDALQADNLVADAPAEALATTQPTGPWTPPVIERQAQPLHTLVTSAFDPSIPLAE